MTPDSQRPSAYAALGTLPPILRGGDGPHFEDCPLVRNNWADLQSQVQHANCCRSPAERELLLIAHEKLSLPPGSLFTDYWVKDNAWYGYDKLAGIISRSTYSRREDLIQCGYLTFSCHDTRLCPLCCFRDLAGPLLDEFGNSISADGELWYVVLSVSSDPEESRRFMFPTLAAMSAKA